MTIDLEGPAGRLEALLDLPARDPRLAVVLAAPHPDRGGTLRSRVIFEAAKGFTRAGAAVLRFNYRGVGLSAGRFTDGHGELLDFQSGISALSSRYPGLAMCAAGYSFGAWVATSVGAADDRVSAMLGIALPLGGNEFPALASSERAKFLIHGERDEVCPVKTMERFYASLREPKELVVIDGADHAFDGYAGEVGDAIEDLFSDVESL